MPFLYTWNATFEGQPADSEEAKIGSSRIRGLKTAVSERMVVDHVWSVGDTDGLHKQVTLPELAVKPTVAANQGAFYTKDVAGVTEAFYETSAGTEIQLTSGNALNVPQPLPVGSLYLATVSTNPNILLGYGTWVAFGTGRALVAIDTGNPLMNTVEETFGSANSVVVSHTHGVTDPGHVHSINKGLTDLDQTPIGGGRNSVYGTYNSNSATTGITINSEGVSGTDTNYQPSIAIYVWKRTA